MPNEPAPLRALLVKACQIIVADDCSTLGIGFEQHHHWCATDTVLYIACAATIVAPSHMYVHRPLATYIHDVKGDGLMCFITSNFA